MERWKPDGTENVPDPYNTVEFHMLPTQEGYEHGLRTFSLFLTKDQRLIYKKRRHMDSSSQSTVVTEDLGSLVYIVGYEEDHDVAHFSAYAFLLPDGRIEWCHNYNHNTIHERNLDVHPPLFYETWGEGW